MICAETRLLCVFTTWLELILSEIPDRTKEFAPPPRADARHTPLPPCSCRD